MVIEGGDDVPPRQQFHEAKTCDVAVAALEIAVIVFDAGAVDEAEGGKIIRTYLLEVEIAAPRLVGIIDRNAERVVIALRVGKAALVIEIRPQNVAGREVRIEELEIRARDRVPAFSRRIAVGEHHAEL